MQIKDAIKPKKYQNIIRYIILIICLCVFVFSVFMLARKLYGYYHDNKQYEQIREQVSSIEPSEKFEVASNNISPEITALEVKETPLPYTVVNGNNEELDLNGILSEYSFLKKQNDQLVGWVRIPGFKNVIDYPVMQAEDNDFYLQNDFYKNFSYAGSIFMDFRNNNLQVDRHTILYGHAMTNRSMFGNFKEFPKQTEDHTKITRIYFDLMNTRLEYEIFSIYYENASFNYRQTSFSSDDEYVSFLENISSISVHDYSVKLSAQDKIITLSTCNSSLGKDMRSVTHARLVRQIIYDKTSITSSEAISTENTEKEIISANTYLSKLSLTYGDKVKPEEAVFTPPFSTAIDSPYKVFTTQLSSEVETVSLLFETADPKAKVSVTLNEVKTDPLSLKLEFGENIIKVKVVSQDNLYTRTYTITATRLPVSELEAEPDAKPVIDPKAEPDVKPETEPKAESETEPKAEPESELKEESEANSDINLVNGPETKPEAE